jgi:outer membrane protein TolC
VEDGLATFLKAQQRARSLAFSADEALEAVKLVVAQYQKGTVDFTRVTQLQQTLVVQQDNLAQAQGEIARGLIQVYKGLGGGWEYRVAGPQPVARLGVPHVSAADTAPGPDQAIVVNGHAR